MGWGGEPLHSWCRGPKVRATTPSYVARDGSQDTRVSPPPTKASPRSSTSPQVSPPPTCWVGLRGGTEKNALCHPIPTMPVSRCRRQGSLNTRHPPQVLCSGHTSHALTQVLVQLCRAPTLQGPRGTACLGISALAPRTSRALGCMLTSRPVPVCPLERREEPGMVVV